MSFGGAVSSMISSIKSNKRTRVNTLEKLKHFKKGAYKKGAIDKKATPRQLKAIRDKLQQENKEKRTKMILIYSIIAAIIFYFAFIFKY